MAVDFPNSPSNGDTTTINGVVYTYNSTKTAWETLESVDANAALSDNPPSNPNNGDLWFNSTSGELLVRYNDGTSSQWVGVSGPTGPSANLSAIAEDILPDADSSRSLGSPTKKWKDLYLSGSTIHLGDSATLSAAPGGEIVLPSLKIGTGSNAVKLEANSSGGLETRAVVGGTTQAAKPAGGTTQVATLAAMQAIVNPSIGDLCSVTANNTIYMYNGTGFYKIATMVNESPSAITGVDGAYVLAIDGTATTITANSSDPEGRILNWSYAVSSGSLTNGGGTTATIAQGTGVNTHVFTITPTTNSAYQGSFSITFNVTDNINGAVSVVSSFTLSFTVTNSKYTVSALKATNTGSNQTFDDASTSNHTITAAGDVTASTFSPHRHGGYSLKFENSSADDNNIKFNNTTGSGAVAASGEFCVETWVKFTVNAPTVGSPNARIFASNGSGGNAANNLQLFTEYNGSYTGSVTIYSNDYIYRGTTNNGTSEVINDDQWHHLAVTRDSSNNLRWFIDGTLITTIASNTTTFQFEETRLGKRDGGTGATCFTGDMRDTRVVIGSSVYESAFTPPIEPLTAITNTYLLVGDLPYIKDESTNNFSIHSETFTNQSAALPSKSPLSLFDNGEYSKADHGASAYFDGSGDVIGLNGDAEFAFGTNDFTVEFWLYPVTRTATEAELVDFRGSSGNGTYTLLFLDNQYNTNNIIYYHQGGTRITSSPISDNAWSHVALTRSGNDVKLFVNGIQEGSTFTNSLSQLVGTNGPTFGAFHDGTFSLTGYMSDIRILNGTAAYTSNFTPPTEPLTAVTNTKFLLNPETSISDLSQRNAPICRGDVETSTTQVKFAGTKSIYFAGSDDYIHVPNSGANSAFSLNSTKFTIEGWFYKETNSGDWDQIISKWRYASNMSWRLKHNTNGTFTFDYSTNGSNSPSLTSTGTLGTGVWAHVALVANNNLKLYINGVGEVLSASALPAFFDTSYDVLIGALRNDNTDNNDGAKIMEYNGWMQDFRIHNNHAQYTANFTPPTAESQG